MDEHILMFHSGNQHVRIITPSPELLHQVMTEIGASGGQIGVLPPGCHVDYAIEVRTKVPFTDLTEIRPVGPYESVQHAGGHS